MTFNASRRKLHSCTSTPCANGGFDGTGLCFALALTAAAAAQTGAPSTVAPKRYVGQSGPFEVAFEFGDAACLINPPHESGVLCFPPPVLGARPKGPKGKKESQRWHDHVRRRLDLFPLEGMDHTKFMEECTFYGPFPPVTAVYHPEFLVCTRMLVMGDSAPYRTAYLPDDHSKGNADCEALPLLMELTLGGFGVSGIAADVGASIGNCGFYLLSRGHTVFMFDHHLDDAARYETMILNMTLEVNAGWSKRAFLRGTVKSEGLERLDVALADVEQLHLLKIDVDNFRSIKSVLRGAHNLMTRTDIVQMELITVEIGVQGKRRVRRWLQHAGFEMYLICGFFDDGQLSEHFCWDVFHQGVDPDERALAAGHNVVEYAAHHVKRLQLFPVCRGPAREGRLLRHGTQYAFVRRGSAAFDRVQLAFGSCSLVSSQEL